MTWQLVAYVSAAKRPSSPLIRSLREPGVVMTPPQGVGPEAWGGGPQRYWIQEGPEALVDSQEGWGRCVLILGEGGAS
jgi:hypothetical protein